MESIFEQQRNLHEEKERYIESMVKEILRKKTTHHDQINSDHRLKFLRDSYMETLERLSEAYRDRDGIRKEEFLAIGSSKGDEFGEFYSRFRHIKDFHKKHLGEISVPLSMEFDQKMCIAGEGDQNLVEFSGEECYGKYLDLHECHQRFVNLKNVSKCDYISYLETYDKLFEVPVTSKSADYHKYLYSLLEYLEGFMFRIKPLLDIDAMYQETKLDFERKWNSGTFPGWLKDGPNQEDKLDLAAFSSPEELMSLGLDRMKQALISLGLKCGGTLEERAQRLFITKNRSIESMDPSHFAKVKRSKKDAKEKHRELAALEAKIYSIAEMLSELRIATKENVLRKQARTGDERQEEELEAESADEDDDENDEDIPYNPKNLPLGWDGKPIPYWLYKLHGLNVNYSCEICGNQTYRGPKAFQRHFSEWRHAHGMRCLSIPNTAHFANVTLIEDALALWEKLKSVKSAESWNANLEEDFEDSRGNVMNKKMYDDMVKQNIL